MKTVHQTAAEPETTNVSEARKRGRRVTDPKRLWGASSALLVAFGILTVAQRTLPASVGAGLLIASFGVAALGLALWLFNDYLKVFFD